MKPIPLITIAYVLTVGAWAQQIRPPSMAETELSIGQNLVVTEPGTLSSGEKIPAGSSIYVSEMPNGFENYLIAGLQQKKVPVMVVTSRDKANYVVTGVSSSEAANWAKMLFRNSESSRESASIKMIDVTSGKVVFAYSVHKSNSMRGMQSAGEACAKHIKERIVPSDKAAQQ